MMLETSEINAFYQTPILEVLVIKSPQNLVICLILAYPKSEPLLVLDDAGDLGVGAQQSSGELPPLLPLQGAVPRTHNGI